VIIVEAGERSGALLTADWALAQGRDVMAVPGDILEPRSRGTNRLLKDGAHVLTASSDALDLLFGPDALMRRPGPVEGRRRLGEESTAGIEAASRRAEESSPQADRPDAPVDEPLPRRLARALTREARHAEEIAREVGASVAETRAALLRLEISGGAVREPGGGYRRPS
jgi:DNA processing protein